MSIISLKSENKYFSFIISKNPESGLTAKPLRKGVLFGYYTEGDESSYNIYFKDGSDEVSFPEYEGEEFEYLNSSRYNSASFIVSAIDEMLRSAFKSNEFSTPNGIKKDSGGSMNTLFINMIKVKNKRYIDAFEDYFPDFKIDEELINENNYQITIRTYKSIYELLNFTSLFGIFNAIVNNEPNFIKDENIVKYIRCMNIIDAPYFLRYLFKIRFIKGMNTFNRNIEGFGVVKDELSKNKNKKIEMTFGDTWQARQMAIEERLDFKNDVLEIGVGEGKYITRFNRYMKNLNHYAIDIDNEVIEEAKRRVNNKGLKNVYFFNSTQDFLDSGNNEGIFDVILTEVIEHMSILEAESLIKLVIDNVKFNKFIITTPNADFNKNYFMEGFRHQGHVFEMSSIEFKEFINKIIKDQSMFKVDFIDIGDLVDGDTPTQGCVIKTVE